jgi:hypothetical protein
MRDIKCAQSVSGHGSFNKVSHLDSAQGGATQYSAVLSAGAVTHKAVPVQRAVHCARVQQLILLVHVEAGNWFLKLRRRKLGYKEIRNGLQDRSYLNYLILGSGWFISTKSCCRVLSPQRNQLTRGPLELVQHSRSQGEFTSAQERCMS